MISVDDTNIECLEEFDEFLTVGKKDLPKLLLGFQIKNKFDLTRLQIDENFEPTRIRHLGKTLDDINEWICFYGIDLELNNNTRLVYHSLMSIKDDICPETYNDILGIHQLSCRDNFLLLRRNVFPIDIKHIPLICSEERFHDYENLRNTLVLPENFPWYANWNEFKLFLLT